MTLIITIADIISLFFLTLFIMFAGALLLRRAIEQSRCKHDGGVNETQACDAICRKCGKNLGFIGTWRENNK